MTFKTDAFKNFVIFTKKHLRWSHFLIKLQAFRHTHIHTSIHPSIHTYIHNYIHTYIPTYLPTYTHTYIHMMMICGWTTLTSQHRHPNYLVRLPFLQIRPSKKSCGPPGFLDLFTYFITDT